MSTLAWIILVILVVPALGLLAWVILGASLVRVPSGSLGLLLANGRATGQTLPPGPHFVFAFRKRMVEEYPSVELAYRAGAVDDGGERGAAGARPEPARQAVTSDRLEMSGPALRATLGDRTEVSVGMTIRFLLVPERLREVHERFGPNGVFGVVRDQSARAVLGAL